MQRDTVAHSSEPRTIMHRPLQDTIATIDDFRHSGWEVVFEPVRDKGYSWIHGALATAGKTAVEASGYPQGKVLWLLADACSMMLQPGSPNAPFRPFADMSGSDRCPSQWFQSERRAEKRSLPCAATKWLIHTFESLSSSIERSRLHRLSRGNRRSVSGIPAF